MAPAEALKLLMEGNAKFVKVMGAVYHLESGEVKFHMKPCDWKKAKLGFSASVIEG